VTGAARCLRAVVTAMTGAVLLTTPAAAQTADELFGPAVMHDLHLLVNARDLDLLRLNYLEDTYYQADVQLNGLRVRNAAIRSRGNGSRSAAKPGLRIDFNRYISGQRFLGFKSLVLDNLVQDATFLRENVTMALFARMGQAAPREAYVRLFINGRYEGLYTAVEPIDGDFVERATGDPDAFVFDYEWMFPYYGDYLGYEFGPYKELFKAETRTSAGDVALYAPIHDLFAAVNRPVDGLWRETVEKYLDVPQFLTHVAIERFVAEIDGVTGLWAMNNFYLYRRADSERHQVAPWDRDNAFTDADASILLGVQENRLLQGLLAFEDLRAFYFRAVDAAARSAADDGWLEGQIAALASMIRDAVVTDPHKPFPTDDFDSGVAFLQDFARRRPAIVIAEIQRLQNP
jgi:spore coat protein H